MAMTVNGQSLRCSVDVGFHCYLLFVNFAFALAFCLLLVFPPRLCKVARAGYVVGIGMKRKKKSKQATVEGRSKRSSRVWLTNLSYHGKEIGNPRVVLSTVSLEVERTIVGLVTCQEHSGSLTDV